MNIQALIDDMIDTVILNFQEDGMTVTMPEDVRAKLKEEMLERLCNEYNEIRDDIETDVRAFATMPEGE